MNQGTVVATIAVVLAYGIYIDRCRQSLPFRHKLKQNRRKAELIIESRIKTIQYTQQQLDFDVNDPAPQTAEGVQAYFMKYLQMGETLLQKGPSAYEQVAVCYFRALKVYPDPMNLMMALEQSLPKLVMEKIMHMMASDVGDADGLRLTELADDELE